jgi:endonuclease/exonuclease/phosphatase family metal-dependent hydrolase
LHGGVVASPAKMRIIGGDLNLVGSRTPLDVLVRQLDGGQDLAVAEPVVLGTPIKYTWYDNATDFTPGRLDYITYSTSSLEVSRAFVLDTTILAEESLYRIGLSPNDTLGSDHLPVVVDFRVK